MPERNGLHYMNPVYAKAWDKSESLLSDIDRRKLELAVELGYVSCEKGLSLQQAIERLHKTLGVPCEMNPKS